MASRHPAEPVDAQRHREVLVAVYELIAAHGIDGTTMRQVAAAAQLSTGTLNYHFTNKRGLILAALDYAYWLPRDWHRYEGSALARLGRIARNYTVDRPPLANWWRFWAEVTAHAARDHELRRHQQDHYRALVRFVADVMVDGMASGELRPGLAVELEATRFVDLAHGAVVQQLLDPESSPAAAAVLTAAIAGLRAGDDSAAEQPHHHELDEDRDHERRQVDHAGAGHDPSHRAEQRFGGPEQHLVDPHHR